MYGEDRKNFVMYKNWLWKMWLIHHCTCWGASLQLLVSITAAAGEHQCRSCGLIVAYWAAPEKGTLFSMEDSASSWVLNKVTERVQYLHTIYVNITFLSQDQSSPESTIYTSILYMYTYLHIHLSPALCLPFSSAFSFYGSGQLC